MRRHLARLLLVFSAFFLILSAQNPVPAAVPGTICIQGRLTNASGKALTGQRAWRVGFFSAPTGGSVLSGNYLTGQVTIPASGRFSIELTPPGAAWSATNLYYELAIDSAATPDGVIGPADVFPTRVKVDSVSYAQYAQNAQALSANAQGSGSGLNADLLDGIHASGFVTPGNLSTQLATKADASHTHSFFQITGTIQSYQLPDGIVPENDTLASVVARGNITERAVALGDNTNTTMPGTGALQVWGGASVSRNLWVSGKVQVDDTMRVRQELGVTGGLRLGKFLVPAWTSDTQAGQVLVGSANLATRTTADGPAYYNLPTSIQAGDIVRFSGVGTGGWAILLGSSQRILLQGLRITKFSDHWSKRGSAGVPWTDVAVSASGTIMAFCGSSDYLYISKDGGRTTDAIPPIIPKRTWSAVSMSSDASLIVGVNKGEYLYRSTDVGATWTSLKSDQGRDWRDVAVSADGSTIIACVNADLIYISTDNGSTWSSPSSPSTLAWRGVASSADGSQLFACADNDYLYQSIDGGLNWTPRLNSVKRNWIAVAMSADGSVIAAAEKLGSIFVSLDRGLTWVKRADDSSHSWTSIAVSADGAKMVAGEKSGWIWASNNSGLTWTSLSDNHDWTGIAMTPDAGRVVAVANSFPVYTTVSYPVSQTLPGTLGCLWGNQGSAIELQYIGNDTFMPLSATGAISADYHN